MNSLKYGEFANVIILNAILHFVTKGGSEYLIQKTDHGTFNVVKLKDGTKGYMLDASIHLQTGEAPKDFDPTPLPTDQIVPGIRLHLAGKDKAFLITAAITELKALESIEVETTTEGIALKRRI